MSVLLIKSTPDSAAVLNGTVIFSGDPATAKSIADALSTALNAPVIHRTVMPAVAKNWDAVAQRLSAPLPSQALDLPATEVSQ